MAVHEHIALAYVLDGAASYELGGRFHVKTGDVVLVPAGLRHRVCTQGSLSVWGLGFSSASLAHDPQTLAPLLAPFDRARRGGTPVVTIEPARRAHLIQLLETVHEEGRAPSAHAALVHGSLLTLVLAELARASEATAEATRPAGLVDEALRYVERHCLEPLSVADVARALDRSATHVTTAVRRATGRTVGAWILAGRMAEARRRLASTDERIDVIGQRVGYLDATHFIRTFRRAHGATPAAWRAARVGAVISP